MQIIKNLTVITKARKQYPCEGFAFLLDSPIHFSRENEIRFRRLSEIIQEGTEYYYLKEKTDEGMKGRKVNKEVYQFLLELNLITFI